MKKPYQKGYVQGTFDMFHIGHLILLQRAKERCEYLYVGVVTDELSQHYKGAKPYIPWQDRADIVAAIRYVDEVFPVGFDNENKLKIWDDIHYDCHFCGDDHSGWEAFIKELNKRGSTVEFFPYTQRTSSTGLKQMMERRTKDEIAMHALCESLTGRVAIYGAGNIGRALKRALDGKADVTVTAWADRDHERLAGEAHLQELVSPSQLTEESFDTLVIAIKNKDVAEEVKKSLADRGIPEEKIWTF